MKQRAYGWFQRWADIEAEATALRSYEPLIVPGLLSHPARRDQHSWPRSGFRRQHADSGGHPALRPSKARWPRRTRGAALAAVAWAAAWMVVIIGGHLGGGTAAEITFAAAMAIFALGESLLSPTLPAIISDLAPLQAVGRYNGLGVLAFTTGFLLGPAGGAAALGVGWSTGLFAVLVLSCLLAATAALR